MNPSSLNGLICATGIDAQWIADRRVRGDLFLYNFPSISAYLAAKSGADPFAYSNFQQQLGDLSAKYNSGFYGLFVQDDWQISSRVKLLAGVRYDLFDVPAARPFGPNSYSQDFRIDKNNFGPRAGVSWSVDAQARTVVRASGQSSDRHAGRRSVVAPHAAIGAVRRHRRLGDQPHRVHSFREQDGHQLGGGDA